MKKLTLLTLSLLVTGTSYGFTLEPHLKSSINRVFDLSLNCEFDTALAYTDSLIIVDTVQPLFPFLKLAILGLRDLDMDRIIDTGAFVTTYQTTLQRIESYETIHAQNSYSMTLRGFVYATNASYYLLHKKYFGALRTAYDALDILEEAKRIDSTNFDCDYFLGFYQCAKAELKKRLWMVMFWSSGSKEQGIRDLERCAAKGQIMAEGSKIVLIDVYRDQNLLDKSAALIDTMFPQYPNSRFLIWGRARYYEAKKQYAEAANLYAELSDSYRKERYGDYNCLITRTLQLQLLTKAGRIDQADSVARAWSANPLCDKSKMNKKVCKEISSYRKN